MFASCMCVGSVPSHATRIAHASGVRVFVPVHTTDPSATVIVDCDLDAPR